MLESGLKPIAEKALDFLCILPTCDEGQSLSLKAVNVALPILGALVVIGIGYKLSKGRVAPPIREPDLVGLNWLHKTPQFDQHVQETIASVMTEVRQSYSPSKLLLVNLLSLFIKTHEEYERAYANRSNDLEAFVKAADKMIRVSFCISDYSYTTREHMVKLVRKDPGGISGITDSTKLGEVINKHPSLNVLFYLFLSVYGKIKLEHAGGYQIRFYRKEDIQYRWRSLYNGHLDLLRYRELLPKEFSNKFNIFDDPSTGFKIPLFDDSFRIEQIKEIHSIFASLSQ